MEASRFPLIALGVMTTAAVAAVGTMAIFIDPDYATMRTFGVFYLGLFTAIAGIATWGLLLTRGRFGRIRRPAIYFMPESLRQGAIIGALSVAALILQSQGRLTFLVALTLVAAAFLAEAVASRLAR